MDLERMLDKCLREQWSPADLDWSTPPPALPPKKEMAVVQYFTDMAGIERLAGALFEAQREAATDPTLKAIFATFVRDEVRHAHVAQMLADYYDVHHYRVYQTNPNLTAFTPCFVETIRRISPEIANYYITCGELVLDIALLRAIDDYVDDPMSHRAMALINRDESRHIAIDFHMTERYAAARSPAPAAAEARVPQPHPPADGGLRARAAESIGSALTFTRLLYHAGPFFKDVFFAPIETCDPSGRRLKAAFKRIQLLSAKREVANHPFVRFMHTAQVLFNHPVFGRILGKPLVRVMGSQPSVAVWLHSREEAERAQGLSFEAMAEEALRAKEN